MKNDQTKFKTLFDFDFNGTKALENVISQSSYKLLTKAIASLTLFTDPEVVKLTKNKGLFKIRKNAANERRGQIINGWVTCDNTSPTATFLWANKLSRKQLKDVQYNHIYSAATYPEFFTSLANICVTPAFLAKLTDTHPNIKELLRYRAYKIYNFLPKGEEEPKEPQDYDHLIWAPYPPAKYTKKEFIAHINANITRCPQSRIALSRCHFGWLLNPNNNP
jgi:hypothetical protein